MDKELSSMAGALRNLPLYTSESHGVHLNELPEWNTAKKTIVRMMRESPSEPASPVTLAQCSEAVRSLSRSSPRTALFLAMMWCLAARAGDVAYLRQRDIRLEKDPREDGTYGLVVTQRYGKERSSEGFTRP
eukprot:gene13287-gene10595